MRTDCKVDNVRVICPNASLLGYGTRKMKAGKCFTYGTEDHVARSLGRVTVLENVDNRIVEKSYVLAAVLFHGQFMTERWVDPKDVREIFEAPTKIATFFYQPKLPYDAHTMRRLMEHGTMSEHFVEHHAERVAMFAQREADAAEYAAAEKRQNLPPHKDITP